MIFTFELLGLNPQFLFPKLPVDLRKTSKKITGPLEGQSTKFNQ